jgi:hypothetical protein
MATNNDARSRGRAVHAIEKFATYEAETRRLFGAKWNAMLVNVTVLSAGTVHANVHEHVLVRVSRDFLDGGSSSAVNRKGFNGAELLVRSSLRLKGLERTSQPPVGVNILLKLTNMPMFKVHLV